MPTYDFRCPNGHDFEKFYRKISDAVSELPCPECGVVAARRVSGGAGLLFKGSGFYLTDYGKDAHRRPTSAGPAKDDAKASDGKRETAAESKGESSNAAPGGAKDESRPAESKSGQAKGGAGTTGSSGE
jgi:putative FmdB family regulatory protein